MSEGEDADPTHILTTAAAFVSNSFGKDQMALGAEYGFRKMIYLRGGYSFEQGAGSTDNQDLTSAFSGPTGGVTLSLPVSDSGTRIGIDYSYRATISFDGTHSIGLRINL